MSTTKLPVRRRWLVGGIVVAVLGIGGAVVGLRATVGDTAGVNTEQQHQTYSDAITKIEVDIGAGNLVVGAGGTGQVDVTRVLRWNTVKPTISESVTGGTLRISEVCEHAQNCSTDYTVTVPASVAIQARVPAGDVSVRDSTGSVDLTNDTGHVVLDNLTGDIHVRSGAGVVTGNGLRSAATTILGDTGDVTLAFAAAPATVDASTKTGNLTVRVPGSDSYLVSAATDTGRRDVSVRQDAGSKHSVAANSSTGNVTVSSN